MSISAYTGLPGSGKSYEVVNGPILAAIKRTCPQGYPLPRKVWTNIPVNIPGVHVVQGEDANGHWYLDAPPGALVVIDECWRYWPAGMKADSIPEEQKSWFAEHRHRTADGIETDICLVTQDLAQVAAFVRQLVDQTFRMRKLKAVGWTNGYRVDVYDGAVTGQRPPEGRFITGQIRRYKKEGFARYKSHTKGNEAKGITVDNRGAIWKRPSVAILPLVLVALAFVPSLLDNLFGAPEVPPTAAQAPAPAREAKPAPAPAVVVASAPTQGIEPPPESLDDLMAEPTPQDSGEWTLLGVVVKPDGTGRALLRSPTGRRVIDVTGCTFDVEWTCDVEGKRVTEWTGNGVLARAQGVTYHKSDGG